MTQSTLTDLNDDYNYVDFPLPYTLWNRSRKIQDVIETTVQKGYYFAETGSCLLEYLLGTESAKILFSLCSAYYHQLSIKDHLKSVKVDYCQGPEFLLLVNLSSI